MTRNDFKENISQAIDEMKKAQGDTFDLSKINLAELERRTGISRSKLRRLKRNGFVFKSHGNAGHKPDRTVLTGFEEYIDELIKYLGTHSLRAVEIVRGANPRLLISDIPDSIKQKMSFILSTHLAGYPDLLIARDSMETIVLQEVIEKDIPNLGICRGIQFIKAALGGTLYQDLPTQFSSDTEHHQMPPYDVPVHAVDIMRDTPLYQCLNKSVIRVNSYHHQAVKKTASALKPMAVSEDGLIEGLYMPDHRFLWAIQWHPEFSYQNDDNSRKIFESFIKASS